MRTPGAFFALLTALHCAPAVAVAQSSATTSKLRVFLDCQTWGCDFDHFRREIRFADWVRDQADAQVHVLVMAEHTGGGGRAFTLTFLGLEDLAGHNDTLTVTSGATDTDPEVRDALTRALALGLVPYAVNVMGTGLLGVTYTGTDSIAGAASGTRDPWDYWVFRIRAGGFLRGESQQRFRSFDGGVAASRVTDALKLEFGANGDYSFDEYETADTTYASTQTRWEVRSFGVWSLTNHWSVGGLAEVGGATFVNQDLFVQGGPAIEYNVFPYGESTRRLLTLRLIVAGVFYDYADTTIFNRMSEGHPAFSLETAFRQNQPWGNAEVRADWLQYLHDFDYHLLELFGELEIRIVRGLSLDLFGRIQRVKDQIYLPKEDLTDEEVLLQRRQLGTDYRYFVSFGLSYRFGSTFNNVVNPRMR